MHYTNINDWKEFRNDTLTNENLLKFINYRNPSREALKKSYKILTIFYNECIHHIDTKEQSIDMQKLSSKLLIHDIYLLEKSSINS